MYRTIDPVILSACMIDRTLLTPKFADPEVLVLPSNHQHVLGIERPAIIVSDPKDPFPVKCVGCEINHEKSELLQRSEDLIAKPKILNLTSTLFNGSKIRGDNSDEFWLKVVPGTRNPNPPTPRHFQPRYGTLLRRKKEKRKHYFKNLKKQPKVRAKFGN